MSNDSPKDFWETRYADSERVWSGRVNPTMSSLVADLTPGRALDLGCGEGGDVLWLARQGWQALGVDISETAVARARAHAAQEDLGTGSADFLVADLPGDVPDGPYDLITASFLQSPVELDRHRILRAAADRVEVGGHLILISHAAAPPWAEHSHEPQAMPTLEGDMQALHPQQLWTVEIGEIRRRDVVGPDGQDATLEDVVILAQRLHA